MSEWSQVEVEIHVVAPRENAASRYGKTASREQVSVPGGGGRGGRRRAVMLF